MTEPTDGNLSPAVLDLLEKLQGDEDGAASIASLLARSPAATEGLEALVSVQDRMKLAPRHREAIALRIAELNGCSRCVGDRAAQAARIGIDDETARKFSLGLSDDPVEQALLALTTKAVRDRGAHSGLAIRTARSVGITEEEILEVFLLIGMHTYANVLQLVTSTLEGSPKDA